MKRRLTALLLVSVAAISLIGCGKKENTVESQPTAEVTADTSAEELAGYAFEVDGVSLTPDMDLDTVLDKLGEPVSTFESESCAKQGMAYHYTFSNYEIETYPDGDTNRVYCISLTNDTVKTPEGIDLSNTKDDVIAAYGEPTDSTDAALIYKKDGSDSALKFIFESDDTMVSIEYDSKEM